VVAGLAVLVLLLGVSSALIPAYFENMEFQRYLDRSVQRTQSPEALVVDVVNKAAQLGLPVRAGDVHVTRTENGLRVELIYVIRVDLPLYTVDLHFHPAAGG
jgi:type II secretory ATPase GspE/PulE/Tfp pilus assembly ATPase PilB-like protein